MSQGAPGADGGGGTSTDGLAGHYTQRADDRGATGPAREAAVLFAVAEGYLNNDEEHVEAMKTAYDALKLFQEAGDAKGEADTMRVIISCYRCKAQWVRYDSMEARRQVLAEAEELALSELKRFKENGNKRGEACMMLCMGDLLCMSEHPESGSTGPAAVGTSTASRKKLGQKRRDMILEMAVQARNLFHELNDPQMEGSALCVEVAAHIYKQDFAKAWEAAEASVELFRVAGDKKGEARALHGMSVSIAVGPTTLEQFEKGAEAAKQALELHRELGNKKMQAWEANFLAKWYLMMERPREALAPAKEAARLFRELGYGKGWQPESQGTVCKALMGVANVRAALRTAKAGVEQFRAMGDKRAEVLALENLICMHMEGFASYEQGDLESALKAATDGVKLCQELKDKKWEANMTHNIAQAAFRLGDLQRALEAVTACAVIYDEIGETADRAVVLQTAVEILLARGEAQAALDVAKEIRRLHRDNGRVRREAGAMLLVAQVHLARGEKDQAMQLAQEAQAAFQKDGDRRGEAMCWAVICEVRNSSGEKDDAIRASRTMQALFQQAGDKKSQAYAAQTSAGLFAAKDSAEDALRAAQEALALARASGDDRAEVEMLNLVAQSTLTLVRKQADGLSPSKGASALIAKGEERALRPAREAVALARKLGDKQLLGVALFTVGQIRTVMGRPLAGRQAVQESLDLLKQTTDKVGQGSALLLMAETYFQEHKVDEAKDWAGQAETILKEANDKDGLEKVAEALRRFSRGSPEAAALPTGAGGAAPPPDAVSVASPRKKQGITPDRAKVLAMEVAMASIGTDEALTLDDPLMDLGLDSLASVAFREELMKTSGLPLPTSLVFDYPSLHAIIGHMVETSQEMM